MKKHEFYQKYANAPMGKRFTVLTNDFRSPILGMSLERVYDEIKSIDDNIRPHEIRREKLLEAVEQFL